MPPRDRYHEAVRTALEREGWTITHDPYLVAYGQATLHIDLGAEMPIAAEKAGRKIAVEVKTFMGPSPNTDLERALGQYVLYRTLVTVKEADRQLFLAVPMDAYNAVFDHRDGQRLMESSDIKMIVYDPESKEVLRWRE